MKAYPSYRDSGVEWIGEIPENWEYGEMKYQLSNNDGGVWGKDIESDSEGTIVIRSTEIKIDGKWDLSNPMKRKLDEDEIKKCKLYEGDIVITKSSGSPNHIGKSVIVSKEVENLDCCYSNFVQRIRFRDYSPRLYHYILNSYVVREQYRYLTQSTTGLGNLNGKTLDEVRLPFIPLPEQQKIVDYLDEQTQKIDELIEKTEKKIELLKEQRISLINHCVTKGLDPNVEMKDSGVEWIGEIPSHWEIIKGKYILKILTGNYPNEIIEDDNGVSFVKVEDLNHIVDKFYLDGSELSVQRSDSTLPLENNILIFPKRGMAIFTNKIVICRVESFIDPNLMGVKVLQNSNIKFVLYVIKNRGLGDICDSSTIPQINNKHIYPLEFPYPSLPEQQQIADYLDEQTQKIDTTIEKETQRIELLKEYRQSLISEVVTGKIDVRDEVVV